MLGVLGLSGAGVFSSDTGQGGYLLASDEVIDLRRMVGSFPSRFYGIHVHPTPAA